VLLPLATQLRETDAALSARIGEADIERIVALVPDDWLADEPAFADVTRHRRAYVDYFCQRLAQRGAFVEEAIRVHSSHV
jgi:hypothetical protein